MTALPYILLPDEELPDAGSGVKASAESTGGVLTLIDSRTSGGAPMHVHENEDECFYVVEGTIQVWTKDDEYEAPVGAFVFLPRGTQHAWDVVGERARVLIITVPGGFERFLREFHEAAPHEQSDVALRYGIRFIPETD